MLPITPPHERPNPRGRIAMAALVIAVLAGCASQPPAGPDRASTEPSYVGVFTGEFVAGMPLYRFPTIEVVGSRKSVMDDRSSERDRSRHADY